MFYLSKFCRICVKTGGTLMDIESRDYDLVTLSEKLQACTKMVVKKSDLSQLICTSCVKKLRVSYVFQTMCARSEDVLQKYLVELLGEVKARKEEFVNSELRITVEPIPHEQLRVEFDRLCEWMEANKDSEIGEVNADDVPTQSKVQNRNVTNPLLKVKEEPCQKRKRVSKGQRCSLLKKLLSTMNNHTGEPKSRKSNVHKKKKKRAKAEGGLKDLLYFIKDYNFGYRPKTPTKPSKEASPLDRLENFSRMFFYTDFTEYRKTILSIIQENRTENSDDDDDMFGSFDEVEDTLLWKGVKEEPRFEEVVVEPDIKIKQEPPSTTDDDEYIPTDLVQTCYGPPERSEFVDFETYLGKSPATAGTAATNHNNNVFGSAASAGTSVVPSSLELLQQLTNRTKGGGGGKKTMSPNSLKCRTRGRPFINPQLMEQFKRRSFQCDTCNRSFKSPGYLHSHCTKMGH